MEPNFDKFTILYRNVGRDVLWGNTRELTLSDVQFVIVPCPTGGWWVVTFKRGGGTSVEITQNLLPYGVYDRSNPVQDVIKERGCIL